MKKRKRTPTFYELPKAGLLRAQPPSEYFDVAEAAQFLRVSVWTLRKHMKSRELHCLRVGRRTLLGRHELVRFLDAMTAKKENEDRLRAEKSSAL